MNDNVIQFPTTFDPDPEQSYEPPQPQTIRIVIDAPDVPVPAITGAGWVLVVLSAVLSWLVVATLLG
jgi:hypothetical protein